ncbi:uncharacterized protein [Diabrotica undecimpunctata]
MSDEDYNKKMEELQKYMPFLEKMINQLKTDPNKKFQLSKIQSLYTMIRDKKLKIETLNKCQEVISKIYKKMNPTSIESDDTTRTICCSSSNNSKVLASSERILHQTVDGYASARDSMKDNLKSDEQKKRFSVGDVTILSNPPINHDDLKCLDIDAQKKLNRTSSVTKLGDEHNKVTNELMVTYKPTHDHLKDCVKADYNLNLAHKDVKDHSNELHLSKSIPLIPKVSSHSTEESSSDFGSILSKTDDKLKEIHKEQEEYRYVYIHVEKNKEEAKKINGSDRICLTKNENYKKHANSKNNDNQIAREMNMFQQNDQLLDKPMNTNLSKTDGQLLLKPSPTTLTPNSVVRGIHSTHDNPQGLNLLASSNENFVSAYEIEYNASRRSHDPHSSMLVPNITLPTSNMEQKCNQPFSNNHREPPQYYSTQNTDPFSPSNHIPPVLSVSVPYEQGRKQNQNTSSCGLVNKVIHKQETGRDPRAIRNSRDKHSKEIKDPRLNKHIVSNRKQCREKESNVTKPNLEVAGKSNEDIRLIRGRSSSLEDSRSDQYESKFDLIYSRINRHESCARSKSPTKPVSSPSDSPHGNKEQHKNSTGYGLQSFRIPKKNKQETEKAKEPKVKASKETVNQDEVEYHHSNKNVNLNKCQGDSKDSLDCVNKKPYVLVSNPRIPPANNIPNKTDFTIQINRREIKNSSSCVDNGQLKVCTKSAIHGLQTYGISKKKRKRRRKAKKRETETINETINQYGIENDHQNRNINCSHGEESTDSSGSLNKFKSIPVSTMNDIPNKTNLKTLNSRRFENRTVGIDNDALKVCKEDARCELQRYLTSKKKKAQNRKAKKQEIHTNNEINKSAVDHNLRNKNVDNIHGERKNKGSFDYLNKTKPVLEPIANDTPNKKHLNKNLNKREITDSSISFSSFRIPKKNKEDKEIATEQEIKTSKETIVQNEVKHYIENFVDFNTNLNKRTIDDSYVFVDNKALEACLEGAEYELEDIPVPKNKTGEKEKVKKQETETSKETINQDKVEQDHLNKNVDPTHVEGLSKDLLVCLNKTKSIPVSTANDTSNKMDLNNREIENNIVWVHSSILDVSKQVAREMLHSVQITKKTKKERDKNVQGTEMSKEAINQDKVKQDHLNKSVDRSDGKGASKDSLCCLNKTKSVAVPTANDTSNIIDVNIRKIETNTVCVNSSTFDVSKQGAREALDSVQISKKIKEVGDRKVQDTEMSIKTINQYKVEQDHLNKNVDRAHGEGAIKESLGCLNKTKSILVSTANDISNKIDLNKRTIENNTLCVDSSTFDVSKQDAREVLHSGQISKKIKEEGDKNVQDTEMSIKTNNQDKDHLNKNIDRTDGKGASKDSLCCLNKTKSISVPTTNDTSNKMDLNKREIENYTVCANNSTFDVSKQGAREALDSVQLSKKIKEVGDRKVQDTEMSIKTINQDKVEQDHLNKNVDRAHGEGAIKESLDCLNKTKSISPLTANDTSNKMDLNNREIENNTLCVDSSTFDVSKQDAKEVLHSGQMSKKNKEGRDKNVKDTEMSIKTNNQDKDHLNKDIDRTDGKGASKDSCCLNKTKSISVPTANDTSNKMDVNKREIENYTVCANSSTFDVSKQGAREALDSVQISKKIKEVGDRKVQDTEMSIKTINQDKVEQDHLNKNVDRAHGEGAIKESLGCLNKTKSISVSTANDISNKIDLNKRTIGNNTLCVDSSTFDVSKQDAREVLHSGQISKKIKEGGDKNVQDTEMSIKTNNQDKVEQDHLNKNVDRTHGEGATKETLGCLNKIKSISVPTANDTSNKMDVNIREIETNTVCVNSSTFDVSKQGTKEVLDSVQISKKVKEEGDKNVQDTEMSTETINRDKVEQDHLNKNVDRTHGEGATKETLGCLNKTKFISVPIANDTSNKMDVNKREIKNNTFCANSSTLDVSKQGTREVLDSVQISKKVKEEGDKNVQDTEMSIKTNNQEKVEQDHLNKNVDRTHGEGASTDSLGCLNKKKSIPVSTANDISYKREIEKSTVCVDNTTLDTCKEGTTDVLQSFEISKMKKQERENKLQLSEMSKETNNQNEVDQDYPKKEVDHTHAEGESKDSLGCLNKTKSISLLTANDTSNKMDLNNREIENNIVCVDSSTSDISKQGTRKVLHSVQMSKEIKEEREKKVQDTEMSTETINQDKVEQDHVNKNVDCTLGEGATKESLGCLNKTKSISVSTANDISSKIDLNKREIENNIVCVDSSTFDVSKQGTKEVLDSVQISKKIKEEGDKNVQDTEMSTETINRDKVEQDHPKKDVDHTHAEAESKDSLGCLNKTKSISLLTANDTSNKMDLNNREIENNIVCVDSSTLDISKQGTRKVLHSVQMSKEIKEERDKNVQDTEMSIKTINQDKVEQDHVNKNVDRTLGEGVTKESLGCLNKTKSISVSTANDISSKIDLNKREIENNIVCVDSSTFDVSKQGTREVLDSVQISKKIKEEGDKNVQDTEMSTETINRDKVEQDHPKKDVDHTHAEGESNDSLGCLNKTKSISLLTVNDTSNKMDLNNREIENNIVCVDSSTSDISKQGTRKVLHSVQMSKEIKEEREKKVQDTEMSTETINQDKVEQDHVNKNVDCTLGEGATKESLGCLNKTKSISVSTANDISNKIDLNKREIENNIVCVDSSTFDVSKQGTREVLDSVQISKKIKEEGDKNVQDTEMSTETIHRDKELDHPKKDVDHTHAEREKPLQVTEMSKETINQNEVEQDHLKKNIDISQDEGKPQGSLDCLNKTNPVSTANDIPNKADVGTNINVVEIEVSTLSADNGPLEICKEGARHIVRSFQISKKQNGEREKKEQETEMHKGTVDQNELEQNHPNKNVDISHYEEKHQGSLDCLNKTKHVPVSTANDLSNETGLSNNLKERVDISISIENDNNPMDVTSQCVEEKELQTSIIIENQIRNHLDVDSKTKNNENSQFYRPSTSKNIEKSVKPPIEQTILAKHFANLLGSQDKQEKKTAIYSLISTFSDSFSPKELHKINKIINSKDEYEDSSDEELSLKTNSSNTNKNISHEEVNINDIKDQDTAHEKVITKHKLKQSSTSNPVKQHTDEVEGDLLSKKTAGGEDILEDTGNYMDQENEILVTVEENIKSKREPILGDKPRKKRGSELDRLHDDIREMFIRDDVLTASGKRMCHMLKDSSIATNTENIENNTEKIVFDALKRVRPKCKNKKQKTMKDLTVIECNEACTSAELTKSFEYSNSYSNKEVDLVSDDSQNTELLNRKHASSSLVGIIVKKKKKLNFDELIQPKLTDTADMSAVSYENKIEGSAISNAVKRCVDISDTIITSDRNDKTYETTPPSVINKPIQLNKAFNLTLMNLETETRNGQETTLKRVKDLESPCGDPKHSYLFHTDSYNELEQCGRTHTRIAADKGSMITQSKLDPTFLCKPYRCVPGCHLEFLFENEFSDHIMIAHKKKNFLICGDDSCSRQVKPADISRHWSVWHNVSVYQCSYCKSNTNEINTMNYHLSIAHPNVNPEILVRVLSPKMPHYVFYTQEAFSKLRKIVDIPNIPLENTDTRTKSLNKPNLVVSSPQNSSTTESNINSVSANTSTLLSTPTTLKIISNSSTPLTNSLDISSFIDVPLPISPVDKPLHRTVVEESSSSSNQKSSPCGLLDYQLFKCATCMLTFSTLKAFKKHVTKSEECKNKDNINKPFVCAHCNKSYKNCNTLCVHIQYHGVSRYSCSVCGNKFHTFRQARGHMKRRHDVSDTTQIVLNSATDSNGEKYIIERKPLKADQQHVYNPEDIGKIPLQPIFSTNLRCGTCPYTTKVRMNMTRHLQFHLQKIPVPSKSPINPVQYMINNGASISPAPSQISDNSVASIMSDKNDAGNFPDFVPSCLRYTCCAKGCKYICPEEENLRHHFTVLHSQELNFICVHCKINLNSDANDIINHLNLHGSQLYKCQYCDYVHNLKHKIERHIKDKHADFSLKVITLRCIELEPKDIEDTSNKVPVSVAVTRVLNTTPFCEDSASAMRPSMLFDKSTPILTKSLTRETESSTAHSKNITSQTLPVPTDMLLSTKCIDVDEMIDRINQLIKTDLNGSNNIANDEDSAVKPKQKDARELPFEESSSDLIKRFQESRLQFYCSTIKPSKIITPQIMDLAVSIDPLLSTKCDDTEDMINRINQLIKLELSEIIIVSDDEDHDKNINNNQNIDVAGSKFEEEFGEQSLIKTFGSFGLPFLKQLKCPKCNNFKSRRMSDFIFHIFRENETSRYGCKICSAVSVTYKCMYNHVHMQHKPFDVNNIIFLPKNPRLEAWLQILIKTQCTAIIGISATPQEISPDSTLNKVLCRYCNKWYKSEDEHQHAMFHWASTPFKCSDCRFEAYTQNQVLQHHIAASHGKGEISSIIQAGPTVANELEYFDFLHMEETEEEI